MTSWTRKQAALYEQSVKELAEQLKNAEGIQRKGLVLSFLMRFKQICNHPSQWLVDGAWGADDSGKWARLRDIAGKAVHDPTAKVFVRAFVVQYLHGFIVRIARMNNDRQVKISGLSDLPTKDRDLNVAGAVIVIKIQTDLAPGDHFLA